MFVYSRILGSTLRTEILQGLPRSASVIELVSPLHSTTTRNSPVVDLCVFDLLQWTERYTTQGQWTIAVRGTQEIIGYGLTLMSDSIYSRKGFPGSRSSFSGWCTIRKQVQISIVEQ